MHAAEYKDTIMKRSTVITRGIWEILRVKMQHISIVTLSLRVVLSDSVQTEFTWMRSLRLHETAHVFIQMKWKMFTVNSGELSCTIKIKQPRKLSQEERAEQPPEGTFLKVSRLLSQLHAKSCKSLTDPSTLWPHLLTFSLFSLLSIHTGFPAVLQIQQSYSCLRAWQEGPLPRLSSFHRAAWLMLSPPAIRPLLYCSRGPSPCHPPRSPSLTTLPYSFMFSHRTNHQLT